MVKVLVTGGAGYIGSHTILELLKLDYSVICIDSLCNSSEQSLIRLKKLTNKPIEFYNLELNYANLEIVLAQHVIDCVFHFAGLKSVEQSVDNPILYYQNNVVSSIELLKIMLKYNINKLVFSSSATVYGKQHVMPIKESAKLEEPVNPYGKSKAIIENIIKDCCNSNKNLKCVLLRYFNPVGADESGFIGEHPLGKPNNLMPYIALTAMRRLNILNVYGSDYDTTDGTGVRDYIHVTDLALGHIAAYNKINTLKQNTKNCLIYNLGRGKGYSVMQMIKSFEAASNIKIPYKLAPRRKGDLATVVADPTKANNDLNWTASRDIDVMCRDLWNWQKNNPDGYIKHSKL